MSFPKNDRKFRAESGKTFPVTNTASLDTGEFHAAIARALREDFGGSTAAVKRVAKLVGSNERTVRNWFDGRNGPSGEHLVVLMHHSDAVVGTVLTLSGRDGLARTQLVADAKEKVNVILQLLGDLTVNT